MPLTMFQFTEEELSLAPQLHSALIPEHLKGLASTDLAAIPIYHEEHADGEGEDAKTSSHAV